MKKENVKLLPSKIEKAKRVKTIIAIFVNLAVILLAIAGLLWSYFINRYENIKDQTIKLWFWGWFTFLSTAFVGIASTLTIIFMLRGMINGTNNVPTFVYVIKTAAIAATIVTFIITQFDLLKDIPKIHITKIERANFIEHLLIPALSITCYLLCERTIKMKLVHNCYSMILGALYSGHYLAVGYKFIKPDGTMPSGPIGDGDRYDRYGIFKILGPKCAWLMIFLFCGALFLFSWLTWLINRKIHIGEEEAPKILGKEAYEYQIAQLQERIKASNEGKIKIDLDKINKKIGIYQAKIAKIDSRKAK